jgi:hypothetical protein
MHQCAVVFIQREQAYSPLGVNPPPYHIDASFNIEAFEESSTFLKEHAQNRNIGWQILDQMVHSNGLKHSLYAKFVSE